MKLMTTSGHVKGVAMNKPNGGHISTGGGTDCIEGYGGAYPYGWDDEPVVSPIDTSI